MIRNRPTPAGGARGRELARLVDEAEPHARLIEPAIPPRCASCAFRAGSHTPNGSETTLADALKCVLENVEFRCHEPARAGQPCSGWLMLHLAHPSAPGTCPWPFSDEVAARGDLHSEDASAQREGHHDLTFGPADIGRRHPTTASALTGQGVCETHTPWLRSERRSEAAAPVAITATAEAALRSSRHRGAPKQGSAAS